MSPFSSRPFPSRPILFTDFCFHHRGQCDKYVPSTPLNRTTPTILVEFYRDPVGSKNSVTSRERIRQVLGDWTLH